MSTVFKLLRSFSLYHLDSSVCPRYPAKLSSEKLKYLKFSNFSILQDNMTDSMKEESVAALLKGIDR